MTGTRLPMFPLSTVLFPHASLPLHVFEPRYRALMHDCLEGDRRFGVVLIERGSEVGGGDQRSPLGTRGVITKAAEMPDGRWLLVVTGECLVEVEQWLPDDPYPAALVLEVRPMPGAHDPRPLLAEADRRVRRTRALLAEQGGPPALPPGALFDEVTDPDTASWRICAEAPVSAYDGQRLLAADDAAERLSLLVEIMDDLERDVRMLTAE
jgi:Lon protease-like protein